VGSREHSIVKRLCEMLDATIEMQSVAEVGTSFRIPIINAAKARALCRVGS
jgi:hypothetical protein